MFKQTDLPTAGATVATITTTMGTMKARLFPELVGESAINFIELAKSGQYCNAPFHRVIKDFMIQGGDFTNRNGTGGHSHKGPGTKIGDVYHDDLSHITGALSWAKTAAPNSIGSQFFIVHGKDGAHFLDHPKKGGPAEGYSVFGQVFEGLDVLDAIGKVRTGSQDKPVEDVLIKDIQIEVLA